MPIPLLLTLAGIYGGGKLIEGLSNFFSSKYSSDALQQGARGARRDIEQYTNRAAGYQEPYYQGGQQDYQTLRDMVSGGKFEVSPYDYQAPAFNFEADPGYQWRQQEGMGAVNQSMAAQGLGLSGATLKALQKYGQGLASQEYQNAYNRYAQDRSFGAENAWNQYAAQNQQATGRYGRMSDLAGYGTTAAQNLSNLYSGAGSQVADTTIQGANARASGIMGQGQAISNLGGTMADIGSLAAMYYGARGGLGRATGGMNPVNTNFPYGGPNPPRW